MHTTNNCKKRINNTKLSYPIVFLVNGKACFLFFPVALHYIGCKNMQKVNQNLKKNKMAEQGLSLLCHFVSFLGSELGADSLDLKLELVTTDKLGLMHIKVKVIAYGAVS